MATSNRNSKKPALKLIPKTSKPKVFTEADREMIIRTFLDEITVPLESEPKEDGTGQSKFRNNPFVFGASQVNTDLALAAQCEAEEDIYIEDENYFDFFWSSEFQKLQQTFKREYESEGVYALVNMVWRAYNAGLLSPERLEPDSLDVRMLRRLRRNSTAAVTNEAV